MSQVNHGIINLLKEEKVISLGKPQFKRKDMMIWYIQSRMEELDKISLAATKDKLISYAQEYKRLKGGILFMLTKTYDQEFDNSNLFFQFIQNSITINLATIKETITNHILNNHPPQQIDLNRFNYLLAIQEDWQVYLNKIKNIQE